MTRALLVCFASCLALAGCGSDAPPGGDDGGGGDLAGVDLAGDMVVPPDLVFVPPPVPALGAQIDRIGRPLVSTLLVDPFTTVVGLSPDQVKDQYNQAADPTAWDTAFHGEIEKHTWLRGSLSLLDGLDVAANPGDGCGSWQPADDINVANPNTSRYDFLASTFADDELWVDTTKTSCAAYLGVERTDLGEPLTDCGGRTPLMDVVDTTYGLLTVGSGVPNANLPKFTDGIDNDGDGAASVATFPFLSDPH